MTVKRSTTFKDPSKTLTDKQSGWDGYNALPNKGLRNLLRPNIIQMDQKAVARIMTKIKEEELINEMQQKSLQENRENLRNKVNTFIISLFNIVI